MSGVWHVFCLLPSAATYVGHVWHREAVAPWPRRSYPVDLTEGSHRKKNEEEQSDTAYTREGYTATRGSTQYHVVPTQVHRGTARFSEIVEVPKEAHNVKFHVGELPERDRDALQDVR
jgi:hypothetical protein